MTKVKTFLHIFANSLLPQSPYYHKLIKTPMRFTLKYFFALILVVNTFSFFALMVKYPPRFTQSIKSGVVRSLRSFPDDLRISVSNSILTTSRNRPYFFWVNLENKKVLPLVVDETAPAKKIIEYNSYVLLTKSKIVLNVKKIGRFESNLIPYLPSWNVNFTKKDALEKAQYIEQKLSLTKLVLFVLFILPFIRSGVFIAYLSLLSILCFLVFAVFSKDHTFKKTLQISMHAFTLPFVLDAILFVSVRTASYSFILFLILLIVFVLTALYEAYAPLRKT